MIGIYAIEHVASGRVYVGKSISVRARIAAHLGGKSKSYLAAAIRKYGRDTFRAIVLEQCESDEEALRKEPHWIAYLDSRAPNGFNLAAGGEGAAGYRMTSEQRERVSRALIGNRYSVGRKLTEQHKQSIVAANTGRKPSPEARAKMSATHKGRTMSEETRARMSAAKRGKPNAFAGRKHSPESIEKMSEAHRRRFTSASKETP